MTDSLKERLARNEFLIPAPELMHEALARIEELEQNEKDLEDGQTHWQVAYDRAQATIAKLEGEVKNWKAECEWLERARREDLEVIVTLQGKLDRAREGLQMIAAMPNSDLDTPASIARSILSDLKDETNDR